MERHVVTGAFGYTGKYIASRLLAGGQNVIVDTLTNSPQRGNPFQGQVRAFRYHFDKPQRLSDFLMGTRVLYNTYWVRFDSAEFTFQQAVANSKTLFRAAKKAGVQRIVHVSITNPSLDSDLGYFRGKALVEEHLKESGISYAILRPAVLFGFEDILINNIAWVLRRFPVFGVFGSGEYCLQPMYVKDFAERAVREGQNEEDVVLNAAGPETYTFRGLVTMISKAIDCPRPVISLPPRLGYFVGWVIGKMMNDVFLTWEEIQGLMHGLLYTNSEPMGKTRLSLWVRDHKDRLGHSYASELARRRNREDTYRDL
jgi:NADH dehydrogenase